MGQLSGRVAVVTGASSGIGEAIARMFAAEGAAVIAVARRAERLAALIQDITAAGGKARAHQADVTQEGEVEALFASVDAQEKQVDLLVNSAGKADHTPTRDLTLAQWRSMVDTNLTSMFLCSRAALHRMEKQKRGRIINIGSVSSKVPRPNNIAYASTKAGVQAMTHALAIDGREFGITASVLHPGATISELVPNMAKNPSEKIMRSEDIARIALLMAALPDEANLFEALALPIGQPFLGRG
jgi:NAD(P)-dependent dehydrogenase (short-subunit alcohol dehydrogenase family)